MTTGEAVPAHARSPSRHTPLLVALAAVGCSARAARPPVTVAAAPPAPAQRHARLYYEIDQRPLGSPPVPVVRATVGGIATNLMVESGSSPHALAGWLARRAHLTLSAPNGAELDNAGHTLATGFAEHPDVVIEGWGPLGPGAIVVAEMPEPFEAMNVGGLISPQMLAPRGEVVVLDLPGGRRRGMTLGDAVARVGDQLPSLNSGWVRGCSSASSDVDNMLFIVPASLSGRDATLVLDTGASSTSVLTSAPAGASLAPLTSASPYTAWGVGSQLATRIVRDGRVHVGEVDAASAIVVTQTAASPNGVCPHDGLIGMDVLHRCVLAFGGTHFFGRCGS